MTSRCGSAQRDSPSEGRRHLQLKPHFGRRRQVSESDCSGGGHGASALAAEAPAPRAAGGRRARAQARPRARRGPAAPQGHRPAVSPRRPRAPALPCRAGAPWMPRRARAEGPRPGGGAGRLTGGRSPAHPAHAPPPPPCSPARARASRVRRAESRTLAREPLGGRQGRSLARGASGGAAGRGSSRSVSSSRSRSRSGSPGGGGRWGGGLSSREADLVLSVLGAGDDDDTDAGSSVAGSELEESVSEVALSLSLASDAEAGGEGAAGEAAGREMGPAGRSERQLLLDLSDCPSEDSLASWASQAPGPPAGVPEPGHRVEHALAAQARDSLALAEGLRSVLEGREAELAEAKAAVRALQNRLEEERKQGAGRTAGRVQSGQMDFMRTELEMLQGELKAKDGAVADAKRESQQLRQALLDAELDLERVGARTGLLEGRIRDLEGSREKEYAATGVQAGDARVDEPAGLGGAVPRADHDIVVTENRALGLDLGAQRTIIQRLETQNQNLKDQMERITSAANNYKAQCDERIEGIKADLEQRTKEMLEQEHRAQCLQEKLLDSEESTDKSNLLLKVKEDSSESLQKTLADKDAMLNATKLEVRALLQERDTLRGKVRDLEAVLDTQRSRATDSSGLLQTAESQIGVLKKEVLALEKKATAEKQRGLVLSAETEKWRSQSQLQMHQIEALGQELEVEKMSRLAAAARAEDMSAQLASTNAAKAATAAAVFDLKKQVDSLKHELNMRVLELEAPARVGPERARPRAGPAEGRQGREVAGLPLHPLLPHRQRAARDRHRAERPGARSGAERTPGGHRESPGPLLAARAGGAGARRGEIRRGIVDAPEDGGAGAGAPPQRGGGGVAAQEGPFPAVQARDGRGGTGRGEGGRRRGRGPDGVWGGDAAAGGAGDEGPRPRGPAGQAGRGRGRDARRRAARQRAGAHQVPGGQAEGEDGRAERSEDEVAGEHEVLPAAAAGAAVLPRQGTEADAGQVLPARRAPEGVRAAGVLAGQIPDAEQAPAAPGERWQDALLAPGRRERERVVEHPAAARVVKVVKVVAPRTDGALLMTPHGCPRSLARPVKL